MNKQEKEEIYREALEQIVLSGHHCNSEDDMIYLYEFVIDLALDALGKAENIDAVKFKNMSWSEIQKTLTKKSALGKSVIDIYRERKG